MTGYADYGVNTETNHLYEWESMNDATIVKLAGLVCLTSLAIAYFIFVQQDGAIFGTVATAIGTIIGYEAGKSRSS